MRADEWTRVRGSGPLRAALPVGDLSVRMRNDGHEPNRAEKQ